MWTEFCFVFDQGGEPLTVHGPGVGQVGQVGGQVGHAGEGGVKPSAHDRRVEVHLVHLVEPV